MLGWSSSPTTAANCKANRQCFFKFINLDIKSGLRLRRYIKPCGWLRRYSTERAGSPGKRASLGALSGPEFVTQCTLSTTYEKPVWVKPWWAGRPASRPRLTAKRRLFFLGAVSFPAPDHLFIFPLLHFYLSHSRGPSLHQPQNTGPSPQPSPEPRFWGG